MIGEVTHFMFDILDFLIHKFSLLVEIINILEYTDIFMFDEFIFLVDDHFAFIGFENHSHSFQHIGDIIYSSFLYSKCFHQLIQIHFQIIRIQNLFQKFFSQIEERVLFLRQFLYSFHVSRNVWWLFTILIGLSTGSIFIFFLLPIHCKLSQ